MATKIGTASSHTDFFAKLVAFLTADPGLSAAGQLWTKAWTAPGGEAAGLVLAGPGLAGQDRVLVGLALHADPVRDEFWLELHGMSGVLTSATTLRGHVNVSETYVRMFLDVNAMGYWFVANGRRFVTVAKISTVFQACYGGLFLPYATPLRYPYPLMIGGAAGEPWPDSSPDNWRSVYGNHSLFPFSHLKGSGAQTPSLLILSPAGEWLTCTGTENAGPDDSDVIVHPNRPLRLYAYDSRVAGDSNQLAYGGDVRVHERLAPAADGTLTLTQMHLLRATAQAEIYGVFDGCYRVGGFGNSSENIVTVDGVQHLTVQNAYRTGTGDFFAVKLE